MSESKHCASCIHFANEDTFGQGWCETRKLDTSCYFESDCADYEQDKEIGIMEL